MSIATALLAYNAHLVLLTDIYRSIVPGIWLTLARDLVDGVFYRPLIGEGGYGGTRYFPLHFVVIAAFLRAGASPAGAWVLASALSLSVLASGMYVASTRLGVPRPQAILLAACGVAPYFVQQTLYELRCDVLAAGLNIWGLALLLPGWTGRGLPTSVGAGVCFTLAVATKITSAAVPAITIAALVLSGRRLLALRLLGVTGGGVLGALASIHLLSEGRALENWSASMFAGIGARGTFESILAGDFTGRVFYSHFLTVLFALAVAVLIGILWNAATDRTRSGRGLPTLVALLFLGVSGATIVMLSSPGAVASNQAIEWIQVSLIVLAVGAVLVPGPARLLITSCVALLLVWGAAQNVVQSSAFARRPGTTGRAEVRRQVVARLAAVPGPVFSESALWSVLAGRPAVVLDPFMFRIIAITHPEPTQALIGRIDDREFSVVLLHRNPLEPRGQIWFESVDLGRAVADRVVANYRLESQPASDVYLYVPK